MQYLDRYGWPVERFEGRPIINAVRLLLHTKKIKRGKFECPSLPPSPGSCVPQAGPIQGA